MNIKNEYFTLLKQPGISTTELLLLSHIDECGTCTDSNVNLAAWLSTSERSISRSIRQLAEDGLIKISGRMRGAVLEDRKIVVDESVIASFTQTEMVACENTDKDKNSNDEDKIGNDEDKNSNDADRNGNDTDTPPTPHQIPTTISSTEREEQLKALKRELFATQPHKGEVVRHKLKELGFLTEDEVEKEIMLISKIINIL